MYGGSEQAEATHRIVLPMKGDICHWYWPPGPGMTLGCVGDCLGEDIKRGRGNGQRGSIEARCTLPSRSLPLPLPHLHPDPDLDAVVVVVDDERHVLRLVRKREGKVRRAVGGHKGVLGYMVDELRGRRGRVSLQQARSSHTSIQ